VEASAEWEQVLDTVTDSPIVCPCGLISKRNNSQCTLNMTFSAMRKHLDFPDEHSMGYLLHSALWKHRMVDNY